MTYMKAALMVLVYAERPLTIPEITAVAVAQGLVRPRGKTPDRTMSSVLYRRMAADPDAPIVAKVGRFWLRGRPLPETEAAYLSQRARRSRASARRGAGQVPGARTRHAVPSTLPLPPLRLPDNVVQGALAQSRGADFAPTRRERAVARAGERGARLLQRLDVLRADGAGWDAERTHARLVRPLLAHLRYRHGREALPAEAHSRGLVSYLLRAGGETAIALDVRRLGHDLDDDDAWRALGRAQEAGAPFAAVTNGRELRVYSTALVEAHDSPAAGQVLAFGLAPTAAGSPEEAAQAAALWLLARDTVADGGLDAYALDCAVGRALLGALDAPDSPLARALVQQVRAQAGTMLPANLVLRHARLALRGRRGRDGEPLPEDVPAVAAISGPRVTLPIIEVARSA